MNSRMFRVAALCVTAAFASQVRAADLPLPRDGWASWQVEAVEDAPARCCWSSWGDPGETPETAAIREVREEAGLQAEIIEKLKLVEYWYQATVAGRRVRIHKFVHFFLMKYLSGDVTDHDQEVNEARWMEIGQAIETIAFKSERAVLEEAASYILRDA